MICANPSCTHSLDGMRPSARYCSPACKTAHYRERKERRAQWPTVTSRRKRSGLQVSYRKAVDALQSHLGIPRHSAEEALRLALPVRQRLRLEQRSKEAANG